MAMKRYADAVADFGYALNCQDAYPKATLGRARGYANLGRLDDAAVMYRKYMRETPKIDAAAHDELQQVEFARRAHQQHANGQRAREHYQEQQRRADRGHAARPPPRRSAAPTPLKGPPARNTHYASLGVNYDATAKQLKKRFRELALKFHPDKNKAPKAEDRFKTISAAYECLSDPGRRRDYDLTLQPDRPRTEEHGYWGGAY
jgi:tetratricopeptide (TPR) repeat protein